MHKKATDFIKAAIAPYLGIPYFINSPKNKDQDSNAKVGKGNFEQIAKLTIQKAKLTNTNLTNATPKEIYQFQKKHHIGIDCSGLAFHLLNTLSIYLFNQDLNLILIGTDNQKGVRRLSAQQLTSPPNAVEIKDFHNIQTGDLIRMNQGKHLLFVIEKINHKINYVHNSQQTKKRGVHLGQISITDSQKTLNHQNWSDVTHHNKNYSQFFYPDKGDGIFRLKIFS
jgi:hypothetical protein